MLICRLSFQLSAFSARVATTTQIMLQSFQLKMKETKPRPKPAKKKKPKRKKTLSAAADDDVIN